MAQRRSLAEEVRVESLLDRIEDRLRNAPEGFHHEGEPASPGQLEGSGLASEHAALWQRWNGLVLAQGESTIYALETCASTTVAAMEGGRLTEGDRAVGERGGDLLVLSFDPYEEGAEVILVSDEGERVPFASTLPHLILALLAEVSVFYDRDGEFQAELFGDDAELSPQAERRLLRRHLDADPDGPWARVELGRSLRRGGELRGASTELRRALRCAPNFTWAHFELGRVLAASGKQDAARRAFVRAAELAREDGMSAYYWAWAAQVSSAETRVASAREVLRHMPSFVAAQRAAVDAALAREDRARAAEHLSLGLAVSPKDIGLLALRSNLERDGGPEST